jgi:hypothetical protein
MGNRERWTVCYEVAGLDGRHSKQLGKCLDEGIAPEGTFAPPAAAFAENQAARSYR